MIQQSQLAALAPPHRKDLHELRHWLDLGQFGAGFLRGSVEGVWDVKRNNIDFVAFQTGGGIVYETSRFLLYLWRLFTRCIDRPKDHIYYLNGSPEGHLGNGLVTVLSSVIPVVPIIVLFAVHHLWIRMGLILVFAFVAAAILVFGIHMKSDQVLAVTLA